MRTLLVILIGIMAVTMVNIVSGVVYLDEACKSRFRSINNTGEMLDMIGQLRKLHQSNREGHTRHLRRCLDEFDSIVELERVVGVNPDSSDVCHPNHIGKIIDYHRRFVKISTRDNIMRVLLVENLPMVRHFFRRYALQVALTCRQNLVSNLEQSTRELNLNSDNFAQVMPWRQHDSLASSHQTNLNQTALMARHAILEDVKSVFESITTIDHLSWILELSGDIEGVNARKFPSEQEREALRTVIESNDERIIGLQNTCQRMSQYYEGAVMSIVKLSSLGYRWDADYRYDFELGDKSPVSDEQRKLVADWMAATLICHSILKVREALGVGHSLGSFHQFDRNNIHPSRNFQVTEALAKQQTWSKTEIRMEKLMLKIGKSLGDFSVQTRTLAESMGYSKSKNNVSSLAKKLGFTMDIKSGNRPSRASLWHNRGFQYCLMVGLFSTILVLTIIAILTHLAAIALVALGVLVGTWITYSLTSQNQML